MIRKYAEAEVAQSVEQRTENPRVGGSIPPLGTRKIKGLRSQAAILFLLYDHFAPQ